MGKGEEQGLVKGGKGRKAEGRGRRNGRNLTTQKLVATPLHLKIQHSALWEKIN